jgi:LPXTG-motif cell wall-anchored protein
MVIRAGRLIARAAVAALLLLAMAPFAWAAPRFQEADNSIDADDQALVNGSVKVTEVAATEDGWVVIHLDEGGKPGKVIGHTAVKKGETYDVMVKLDEDVPVGGKVWPMLHIDAGTIGTYEFPGPDAPVIVEGNIVMKQITITEASTAAPAASDTLDAADQAVVNGGITVASVNASKDGWVTVHLDEGGKPGKVLGHGAVKAGANSNVAVKLDEDVAVGTKIWPMLHVDAATIGTYEFPGPDAPVVVGGNIVMKQITITAASTSGGTGTTQPGNLPKTGESDASAMPLALAALALFGAGAWLRRRRLGRVG